jgi:tripartite-type tricarboxylate transporter receptor subunit TctC
MFVRSSALLLLGAFCTAAWGATDAAPHFPSKPITLVVGFAPGGGIDTNARLLAKGLERRFGQPVIVENRPGAGSKIANAHVAKAPPDGYTLLVTTAAIAIDMAFSANAGVDAQRDFAPVSTISTTPMILVVNPAVPVASVRELVAYARARPGALNYSSSGTGTTLHLYGELFKLRTGTDIMHVPYKGTAPSLTALLAGDVQMTFATEPSVVQFVQQRKLRALATTGSKRSELLPDVPTMKEAGVGDADAEVWYGVLAPAATPHDVIATLASAIDDVSRSAEFGQRMRALGVEPDARTPEAFRRLVHEEVGRWAEVVKAARLHPD